MEFAKALKDARRRRGLSKYRVAKEVGVTWQTVWKWERGDFMPRSDQLLKLLRLFPELLELRGGNGNGAKRKDR